MDPVKNALTRTKKFVVNHKTAVAVAITATAGLVIIRRNQREFNDFLKEKDLFDEYYNTPEN